MSGGVEQYPEIVVRFSKGKHPFLVMSDGRRFDLTKYPSRASLVQLLEGLGFQRGTEEELDTSQHCKMWSQQGECDHNPKFMRKVCVLLQRI